VANNSGPYSNNGQFNIKIIESLCKTYCKLRAVPYVKGKTEMDNDFLDFIMFIFDKWAYPKTSVKRFITVYKKQRLEDGVHDENAARYMLETFTNLYELKFKKWEERIEAINYEIIKSVGNAK